MISKLLPPQNSVSVVLCLSLLSFNLLPGAELWPSQSHVPAWKRQGSSVQAGVSIQSVPVTSVCHSLWDGATIANPQQLEPSDNLPSFQQACQLLPWDSLGKLEGMFLSYVASGCREWERITVQQSGDLRCISGPCNVTSHSVNALISDVPCPFRVQFPHPPCFINFKVF